MTIKRRHIKMARAAWRNACRRLHKSGTYTLFDAFWAIYAAHRAAHGRKA